MQNNTEKFDREYDCLVKLWTKEELEKMHTKKLLHWGYRSGGIIAWSGCNNGSEACRLCRKHREANRALVKEILATREHIPNKKESKQLRKERIKRGI